MASKQVVADEAAQQEEAVFSNESIVSNLGTAEATPQKSSKGKNKAQGASYIRAASRKPRVIRISKVPGTTMKYRIQEVDANHELKHRDVTYAEAIQVSKRTGVKINQS